VYICSAFRDPNEQRRCDDEDSHLHGQEVRFEQAVKEVEDALVVWLLECVVNDIREDATLWYPFGGQAIELALRDINVRRVIAIELLASKVRNKIHPSGSGGWTLTESCARVGKP
jgi:hypothetical protein